MTEGHSAALSLVDFVPYKAGIQFLLLLRSLEHAAKLSFLALQVARL